MISKPASRSARAMIFAPRSWPSRPGLATRMRSVRSLIGSRPSHPSRIAVDAEGLPEDVGDLSHRHALLHRCEDRRHHVLSTLARLTNPQRRLPRLGSVARLLPGAHPIGLLLLDVHIDFQSGERPLLGDLILVHPDHHLVAAVERALEPVRRLADFLLRIARLDRLDDPAHRI